MKSVALWALIILSVFLFPDTILAAEEHETGWGWFETIGRWVNLLILSGLIFYYTREPIRKFFQTRRQSIQKDIQDARTALEEAQQNLAAVEDQTRRLDEELAEIRRQAEEDAQRERSRLLEQAELEAQKIVSSASQEIDGLTRAARQELKAYAAELSVQLATRRIQDRLDAKTHNRIVDRFIVNLASTQRKKQE